MWAYINNGLDKESGGPADSIYNSRPFKGKQRINTVTWWKTRAKAKQTAQGKQT